MVKKCQYLIKLSKLISLICFNFAGEIMNAKMTITIV